MSSGPLVAAAGGIAVLGLNTGTNAVSLKASSLTGWPLVSTQVRPVFNTSINKLAMTAGVTGADTTARYDWNFGDGTSATGASVAHTYASAGAYTVTLTQTGQAQLAAIQRDIHQMEDQRLGADERQALRELLDRL